MPHKPPAPSPRKRGRPSKYGAELAARICERLAAGETLRAICRDTDMPAESTVRDWAIDPDHPISAHYTRARQIGYHTLADEMLEIADNKEGDPARDRLRVDTRKWMLSKALPKVYGDKIQVDATHHHDLSSLSDEDIARELLHRTETGEFVR